MAFAAVWLCEGFIGGFVTCADDSGVRSAALTVVLGVNATAPLTANAISLFLPLHVRSLAHHVRVLCRILKWTLKWTIRYFEVHISV